MIEFMLRENQLSLLASLISIPKDKLSKQKRPFYFQIDGPRKNVDISSFMGAINMR